MKITINTDNAAFEGENFYYECARILKGIAEVFERGEEYRFKKIYDINGNAVGEITYDRRSSGR